MAVDPFTLDEKERQSFDFSRATIATFVSAPSFDMTKTKWIAWKWAIQRLQKLDLTLERPQVLQEEVRHHLNQIGSHRVAAKVARIIW